MWCETEKEGGCDHITCPRPICGTQWCWHCGKAQSYRSIYRHMSVEHGGYTIYDDNASDSEVEREGGVVRLFGCS